MNFSYVARSDDFDFVAVTTHRLIGTTTSQGGHPIIRSVPFHQIQAVSVTESAGRGELELGNGRVGYLTAHLADGGSIGASGHVNPAQLFEVYRALIERTCVPAQAPIAAA